MDQKILDGDATSAEVIQYIEKKATEGDMLAKSAEQRLKDTRHGDGVEFNKQASEFAKQIAQQFIRS